MKQSTKILIEVQSEEGVKMLVNIDAIDVITQYNNNMTKLYSKKLDTEFLSTISYEDMRSKLDLKATVVRQYE